MKRRTTKSLNIVEGPSPSVVVLTDLLGPEVYDEGRVMTVPEAEVFMREAKRCGFERDDFAFIIPCPPVPEEIQSSDSKVGAFLKEYHAEVMGELAKYAGAKCVLSLGKWGLRQLFDRSVKITEARGTPTVHSFGGRELVVLPLLSPKEVLRFPDRREVYNSDFLQLRSLQQSGWKLEEFRKVASGSNYRWCLDLSSLVANPPKQLALDTEGVGLGVHHKDGYRLLTVQLCTRKGEVLVVPVDETWWNDPILWSHASAEAPRLNRHKVARLLDQLRTILENPRTSVVGHNLKHDIHALHANGIEVVNWYADTMQLAFVVDENMQSKALADCVRRWLAQFSGYSDEFDSTVDKSAMQTVEHDKFLRYAGGDVDVTFRLAEVLLKLAQEDSRQWKTFTKLQMPALRAFVAMERQGIRIDTGRLADLGTQLEAAERELYAELIRGVPAAVLRKHEAAGWSFGRPDFVIDTLFGEDGIRVGPDGELVEQGGKQLKPLLFTKSDGKPSTSAKDHLPYFDHVVWVQKLMEYSKLQKMRSTYVGAAARTEETTPKRLKAGGLPKAIAEVLVAKGIDAPKLKQSTRLRRECPEVAEKIPEGESRIILPLAKEGRRLAIDRCGNVSVLQSTEATGYWKHLNEDKDGHLRIHTSWLLHATNTGRTASRSPNLQNIPKRGELAKAYRKIFLPTPGYKFLEGDLSQIELRIAAWMAQEPEMLRIYRAGGDIHSATAAAVMGISEQRFLEGIKAEDVLLVDVWRQWPGAQNYLAKLSREAAEVATLKEFCEFKRYSAKAVGFGYLYGMGWRKFQIYARTTYNLTYSDEEAKATRDLFFEKYAGLKKWHDSMRDFVRKHGYVRALHGSLRRLPNVESDDEMVQHGAGRQSINAPVQRLGSDLNLIAIVRLARDVDPQVMRPVLTIHDAIVPEVREDKLLECAQALKYYMESPPLAEWFDMPAPPIPILSDVKWGDDLKDMHEFEGLEAVAPPWFRSGESPPDDELGRELFEVRRRRGLIPTF